jgi:hypothetical protein
MSLQILTLKLDGITAGDYLTWCRDPDPPALDFALRSIRVDADPLGDTITAILDWNQPALPAPIAATAAGLPLLPGAQIHSIMPIDGPHTNLASSAEASAPLTCASAAIEQLSVETGTGGVDAEQRPAPLLPGDQKFARELAREGVKLAAAAATLQR